MARATRLLTLLLLSLLMVTSDAVHTSGVEDLPSPQTAPTACGRSLRGSVCDPDRLLSRSGGDAADRVLVAIRRGARPRADTSSSSSSTEPVLPTYKDAPACSHSPGSHGYEVALAVVRRAGGSGSAAARAERLAKRLHDSWGVGDKCGSGVLVLIAVDDRQVCACKEAVRRSSCLCGHLMTPACPQLYISTGASASQAAPDESLDLVLDRMRPLLRAGDFDGAALEAAKGVGEVLAGRLSHRLPLAVWAVIIIVFVGFIAFSHWAERRKRERFLAAKRQLSAIEQAAAAAKAARFEATTCPICMEDFAPDEGREEEHSDGAGPSSSMLQPPPSPSPAAGLKKELLRCGHAFCTPCLSRALAVKLACPICRQPPDRDAPPSPSHPQARHSVGFESPSPSSSASCAASLDGARPAGGADMHVFMPELVFRLRRVQLMFPEFVTPGMVDRWALNAPTGGLEFAQDAAFLRMDPGRGGGGGGEGGGGGGGGGSRGFGGGSSRGGGGRGGSW